MAKIDNIIFGKEIKDLNCLNRDDYKFKLFMESSIVGGVDIMRSHIKNSFDNYRSLLKTNIKFITRPVLSARQKNEDKMIELMGKREDRPVSFGVFISKPIDVPGGRIVTDFFYMDVSKAEIFYISMHNELVVCAIVMVNGKPNFFNPAAAMPNYKEEILKKYTKEQSTYAPVMDGIDIQTEIDFLIKHMDIVPEKLNKRTKRHSQGCLYENHTNNDIEIITSAHLYEIQKSNGFSVKGHFRWQPYGEGRNDKRLIYIQDFQKTGYTSERKLNETES